ncbi:MAG TPA: phosphatidylserine decarboxylase [Longimicrobiales bacterium]|nr:phosphatidylserine decarboxylase [Longimicrobiales bacterium]
MRFAPEGIPFIAASTVAAGLTWIVAGLGVGGVVVQALAALVTLFALFCLWFFRDPLPPEPTDPSAVLAPGQGKIIDISGVDEPTYIGGRSRRISIFLSVFDVHVQRAPVSGTVEQRTYKPGTYAVAWLEKASQDNEQASLGIATPNGKVLVRQIAGLVARRIITDPREGDSVALGQRIGIIRFGSRVDLFLPPHWPVLCSVGDRAVVGRTVLARQRGQHAS